MSKDDPTFSINHELRSQNKSQRNSKTEMSEEEYRESIIQRTMQALAISEKFTELLIRRMQQNEKLQLQFGPSGIDSVTSPKGGKKRKAGNSPTERKGGKKRKGNDGSGEVVAGSTYVNAQELVVSTRQPKLLEGAVMRDYQLDGLEWLVALDLNGANGILADEMGLGKTLQVISLICFLVEMGVGSQAPFIVIGPLSTLHNWVAEFRKFAPKIPVILYHGNKDDRNSLRRQILKKVTVGNAETYPVVVTSFEVPLRDANLRHINWRYLIIDEGHRLKNHKCLLIKELRRYKSTNRLLLTGTPLQNNMTELWSLLNFILPSIVNDMDVFECWFDSSFLQASDANEKIVQAEEKDKVLTTLHKILKPFLLRRVKADVGLNIPPKKEIVVYAQMTPWQNRLYSAVVDKTLYSLQGRQPDLDDPVAIAKNIRLHKKSLLDIDSMENDVDTSGNTESSVLGTRNSLKSSVRSSPRLSTTPVKTPSASTRSSQKASLGTPTEERGSLGTPRLNGRRRRSAVKEGDYKLLANGVPLNAIREEPMFLDDDCSSLDINEDKLLEGLAEPDEEFVTEMKVGNPVSVLRQICNHPYLASYPVIPGTRVLKTDENVVQRSGKMQILDALLIRLKKHGHKVLIFSNFTKMLDVIEDYLYLRNYNYTRLDGTRSLSDRQMNIKKFNTEDDVFVFLISTRAGGLGINLVAADTVIIYDSDWNPQADLQAQDRCHRIGQTRPVVVYRFIVRGTVDQHIITRAETKKQLDKLVIQHGKFKNVKKDEQVSLQELKELLESKERNEVDMGNGLAYSDDELDVLCDRTAVFASMNKEESSDPEDSAPSVDLSDVDTLSECSDTQDALSSSSHASSEICKSSQTSSLSCDSGYSGDSDISCSNGGI